ncbi:bifunctional 3-hydroxydecanoyl-ACP dehydratase/trans-2-decenoyl-ACP isomerase [Saccharobesus litoralis]|uniref:Bifunctional 3-hydroxydecanoyl-ACP dehydratase/trans-2-decenoyl-ACP isomerase n=1 Tax=Saccharobesus litoralis TaxID=2172099 RepID=A0A2S0VPG5_9ALTE|nr:bifunctional 3-hydroxydecanoyl-ACP dehydratase/trans-2-decenoyl-ACP isomerase [Saccharobesus litoralis]AWB66083.1 bifunctional 3-hydroxydecanoyl-ACP dehydratase/trans-2-decenoyl-ACP isomerase [Saccharobesus litoralis]
MQFSNKQILAMARGGFFGEGNAQLPSEQMLMIDQINNICSEGGVYDKGQLAASFNIKPEHWFFDCHFAGDPVMPGCLGLDALWQLLGVYLGWLGLPGRGRALGVNKVKFSGQIYPDAKKIEYRLDIKRVIKRPLPVGIADGKVLLNNEVIYQADSLKVGLI